MSYVGMASMTRESKTSIRLSRRRSLLYVLSAPCFAMFPTLGATASYPSRPVRIVVGFPPGGSSDAIVRLVAESLQRRLGTTVIVENKPGATGVVAARQVARTDADGYTLLYATSSSHAIAPIYDADIGYDTERDFCPLFLLNRASMAILTRPALAVRSFDELIALAKSRSSEPLTYGSPGELSSQNLAMRILARALDIPLHHIPYKGSAPALIDLIGGQLDLVIDNVAAPLPHIRTGRVIPLVVTANQRTPQIPDVPCIGESGLDLDLRSWGGLVAPAGLDPAIQAFLSQKIEEVLQERRVNEAIEQSGSVTGTVGGEQFRAFMEAEASRWKNARQEGAI